MEELELELKKLIVESLSLEDISPGEIRSDEPLFGEGLGLDSIDGLELGMALRTAYGIKLSSVNEEVRQIFASVRSIASYIVEQRRSAP